MKLKHFILALVAMLSGFAATAQTVVSTLDELKAALGTSTEIVVVGNVTVDKTVAIPENVTLSIGTIDRKSVG